MLATMRTKISFLAVSAFMLLKGTSAQTYAVPPPTTAPSGTILDCTNWVVADASSSCSTIAQDYAITLQQFEFDYVSLIQPVPV
jgi:hypothetical protein